MMASLLMLEKTKGSFLWLMSLQETRVRRTECVVIVESWGHAVEDLLSAPS